MASSDSKTFSLSDPQPSTPIPLFNAVPPTTLTPPTPSLPPTYHASSSSFFSHPVFTVSNIKTFVPETLTHDNYIIWKELMIPVFKSKGVYGHIDGTDLCPPPSHPNHAAWVQIDYQILSWIHATISTDILQMIIQPGKTLSAKEAWDAIHTSYQSQLAAKKMYVKQGFVSLQKQSGQSMFQYLQSVKKAADNMYGVGECLTDRDIVFQALAGLDAEYSVAKRTIPHRSPFPSFVELQSLLLIEESTLQRERSTSAFPFANSSAQQVLQTSVHSSGMGYPIHEAYYSGTQSRPDFYGMNRGRGSFYRGGRGHKRGGRGGRNLRGSFSHFDRGFYPGAPTNPGRGSSSFLNTAGHPSSSQHSSYGHHSPHFRGGSLPPLLPNPSMASLHVTACQLCDQLTHKARDCPLLIGTNIASMPSAPTALTATTFPIAPDSKWYIDSGADTHVSSTPGNLSHSSPYSGSEFIQVGNGQLLPVTHSGNIVLSSSSHSFKLNNVLVSPHLRKNLLSVHQFTKDNNCSVEFDSSGFSVKDIHSKNVLLRCNSAEGLYSVSSSSQRHPKILTTAVVSPDVWHLRLGHPSSASVTQLVRRGLILSNNKVPSSISCHACQLGKHTRLPFSDSLSTTSAPFELIHSDVWTSPVMSFTAFLRFSAYVSTQFGARIKAFQCDNGREYDNANFATYFQTNGIHLRSSCPSTPQQNGKAEWMNRTIINMVRSLLFQANLPSEFWVEALYVAIHLINILPCSRLHFSTPHEVLSGTVPSYNHLRPFGCACYPNLSATAAHKLAPRSSLCILLGYPSHHKGYRCLDLKTQKIILSRHVTFNETEFPYSPSMPSHSPSFFRTPFHLLDNTSPSPAMPPTNPNFPSPAMPSTSPTCPGPLSLGPPSHQTTTPTSPTPIAPTSLLPISASVVPSPVPPPAVSLSLFLPDLHSPSPSCGAAPLAFARSGSAPDASLSAASIGDCPGSDDCSVSAPAAAPSSFVPSASSAHVPQRTHSMVTHSQAGVRKLKILPSLLHTSTDLQEPRTFKQACNLPEWQRAMQEEFLALQRNHTWVLVSPPSGANIVGSKWVYRFKQRADGSIERYKARLVAQGYTQQPGIDYDETFSPVVKPVTIRTVLTLAISKSWPIHQLDVQNAFLNGYLFEPVYMSQPPGFVDP
ncbi:hypothetical protein SLEP1_g47962 [Rubroshorea leprosula]|uniref:Integrase catalytic domain-containing protein n=1 Tax=Rubroshorea leprosula TaxID=152421 RepID=A0AAV5LS57_9ROSI|nr:hypothetical protein SLEP1_g47962 [Rubroshorea leprosula]